MTIQFSKQTQFKNWTHEDFTYKYDNVSYTFEAGGVYNVPADIALHFALHLAKREIGDNPHNEAKMKELMNKCFPGTNIEDITKGQTTGTFEKLSNGEAKPGAPTIEPNATVASVQNETPSIKEEEEDEVDDKKAPKFKTKPTGRPKGKTKDERR
jgi:hypothetical protein